ncbi:MAG: tetratricopeptide repeat protein [Myxococcota bacterium]
MPHELDTCSARVPGLFTHVLLACAICFLCACAPGFQVVQSPSTAKVNSKGKPVSLQSRMQRLLQEATIRFEAQDYKGVVEVLHRFLNRPNMPADQKVRATFLVAEAAWQQKQFLLAWPLYESLTQQSASVKRQAELSEIAWVRLMQMADALGQWQQVSSFYVAYAKQTQSIPNLLRYLQGKAAFHLGQNNQALQHLAAVAETSVYFHRARYLMGTIYVRLKNWRAAMGQFDQIVQHSRAGIHRAVHEKALLALARLLYRQGKWKEAITFYERVAGDSSQYAWALYEQALAFHALGDEAARGRQAGPARKHYTAAAGFLHKLQNGYPVEYKHPRVQILLADIARKQGLRTRAQAIYEAVLNTYRPIYRNLAKASQQSIAVKQLRESRLFSPPAHIAGQYRAVQELQKGVGQQSKKQVSPQYHKLLGRTRAIERGVHMAWAPVLRRDLGRLLRWARVGMMHLQIADRKHWQRKMNAVQKQRATAVQRSNNLFGEV